MKESLLQTNDDLEINYSENFLESEIGSHD